MSVKKAFGIGVAAIVFVAVAIGVTVYAINSPPNFSNSSKAFLIKEGQTVDQIADNLSRQDLIRSPLFFRLIAKLSSVDTQIQKGVYQIGRSATTVDILNLLVNGRQAAIRITVPDGFTIKKIARLLEKNGVTSAESFIAAAGNRKLMKELGVPFPNAEGFLFPDTYFFPLDYSPTKIIRHMVGQFFKKLATVYPTYRHLKPDKLGEKIILASIVEREYVAIDEAPIIASVFINRLRISQALESCATVEYVITEQEGLPHPVRLFYRDLDRKSPYNTYRNRGLTPGPISNPGLEAIKAAFFPAETDYLYFVLKNQAEKRHQFSKTLGDHNQAVKLYIKPIKS